MIHKLKFLKSIGQFDSVTTGWSIDLQRFVLVYAENGRGKTTLAAVFRSLASGDPIPIIERRRLATQDSPHVVIDCDGGPPDAIFLDGEWNRTLPQLSLFDDVFIDENVHSGLSVDPRHRRNLHKLVLGSQGVTLSRALEDIVARTEQHNSALRERSTAISESLRQGLSVDDFCALAELPGVDAHITETERALAAARDQGAVADTALFEPFGLPEFATGTIAGALARELSDLDSAAEEQVRAHVDALGPGGEQWIGEGIHRIKPPVDAGPCPFCAQDLANSAILAHYRAYFSEGYTSLKRAVSVILATVQRAHTGDVQSAFERAIRVAGERRQFWSRYCEVPDVSIDTAAIMRDWNLARNGVIAALSAKQAAPLERLTLPKETRDSIETYDAHRQRIAELSNTLADSNEVVRLVKEQAAGTNPNAIVSELARLRATRMRHLPETARLCGEYLSEKQAKARTDAERTRVRAALDDHQTNIFPASQTLVNRYLRLFSAGFRLNSVASTATRAGAACTYSVVINNSPVAVAGSTQQGEPSFRNTLSSGDRNTLALAFFFASLDQDPDLRNKIVVIDDPISSLDDHRSLTTAQEVRRLAQRAGQVFLLSHDKRFLCRVWDRTDRTTRVALEIARGPAGSTLREWRVDEDSLTEHDRRHSRLRDYVAGGDCDHREIAQSIRPHLEAFLRVARPEEFPPGKLLGPFLGLCRRRLDKPSEILSRDPMQELSGLVEYANRFHHDTNPAWETEEINDAELQSFVERTLTFARR